MVVPVMVVVMFVVPMTVVIVFENAGGQCLRHADQQQKGEKLRNMITHLDPPWTPHLDGRLSNDDASRHRANDGNGRHLQ